MHDILYKNGDGDGDGDGDVDGDLRLESRLK